MTLFVAAADADALADEADADAALADADALDADADALADEALAEPLADFDADEPEPLAQAAKASANTTASIATTSALIFLLVTFMVPSLSISHRNDE